MKKLLLLALFLTASLCAAAINRGTTSAREGVYEDSNVTTNAKTYTINFKRPPSADNYLKTFSMFVGDLSPAFNKDVLNYTASVPAGFNSVGVSLYAEDTTAHVKLNGAEIAGNYGYLALKKGLNTFNIQVTAQNGDVRTYVLVVTKAPNTDAFLKGLTLNKGSLNPNFDKPQLYYTAIVDNTVSSLTIVPKLDDETATLTINGASAANNSEFAIPLSVGGNAILLEVTAEDGTNKKTYIVGVTREKPVVTRPLSTDSRLASLTIGGGTLSNTGVTDISVSVASDISSVTVTPTLKFGGGRVTVNGAEVASGSPSAAIPVAYGPNIITVISYAETGGGTTTYTISAYRREVAVLNSLNVSAGAISPAFNKLTTLYNVSVPGSVSALTVTPGPTSATLAVKVNGVTVVSGSPSAAIPLEFGSNTITVVVSGQYAYSSQTYTLIVTRLQTAALTGLVLNRGTGNPSTLSPVFSSGTFNYLVTVPSNTPTVTVTATAIDAGATLKVNGVAATSGAESAQVPLATGLNTIPVEVTAGGVVKTYTLTVTRQKSAYLSKIIVAPYAPIIQVNGPADLNYTASVPTNTSSVKLNLVAQDPGAVIKINGNTIAGGTDSAPIAVPDASTPIQINVTSADGVTTVIYRVDIIKPGFGNAFLSKIVISPFATLTEVSGPADFNYTTSVPSATGSIRLNLTAQDEGAVIKIGSTTVPGGTDSAPIALTGTSTPIDVRVTAKNGASKSYRVTVNRTGSSNAYLNKIVISPSATLTQVSGAADFNYTASVPSSIGSIRLNLIAQDAGAVIKIGGATVASGTDSAPIALPAASTPIAVQVIAEDGTTVKTYHITVNKAGLSNAYLSKIIVSPFASLTQVSGAADLNYTASVPSATGSVKLNLTAQDAGAVIKIGGTTVAGGTDSAPITLTGTSTPINVQVTAKDGTTVKTYKITINKTGSSNAYLSKIVISPFAPIIPVSGPADLNYTASVPSATGSVKLNLTAQHAGAVIKIGGTTVGSGTDSAPITLTGASTPIDVQVTAEDGTTITTYRITINKTGSSNAYLSKLAISDVSTSAILTPVSGAADFNYTTSVPSFLGSIVLNLTAQDAKAAIKIGNTRVASGVDSAPITLGGTSTIVNVTVTAEDGVTVKTYKVTVNRTGSSNAYLSKILFTPGAAAITQVTGTADLNYVASVPAGTTSLKVKLVRQGAGASMKLNGSTITNNTDSAPIAMPGSSVTINIIVTAEDGVTVKTYAVTVIKAMPPVIAAIPTKQGGIYVVQKDSQAQEAQPEELTVKQAVSPNGDGINDRFTITGINAFPENTVRIMNRSGDVIYEAKGYDNQNAAFDGHNSRGVLQEAGTYFYSIAYKKGTETIRKTGYIVLKY